jgi:hypothetical protein
MRAILRSLLPALCLAAALGPRSGAAQAGPSAASPEEEPVDAGDAARDAQARFERERVRWLPSNRSWGGGPCDEILGRMCLRDDPGGDWYPEPEDARIGTARETLLAALAEAGARAPGDPWIVGQRVFYLGEAGRWDEALALAAAPECAGAGGWCGALRGLALHALGRFPEAEAAFRAALSELDPERAAEWSDPEWLLDGAGRRWWSDLDPPARASETPRLWALADPLLLVPGNDLLTEHWARRTVAWIRENARNPYGMRWGSDLEQLLVRYGWEVGWERAEGRIYDAPGPGGVIGHHHPESRPLFPPSVALRDAAAAPEAEWIPDDRLARTAYAPGYAPVLLPGAGQLAVFPRGDRMVVVGAYALPDDTTRHAGHAHAGRDSVAPPWRDRPDEAGLFLLDEADPTAVPPAARASGRTSGGLVVEAPAGRWVASLEVLSPTVRRAGRTRTGIARDPQPPDVFTLSDLLLVDGPLPVGASVEDAAAHALPRTWLRVGERFGVVWELFGLGYREEVLSYRLTVAGEGDGVIRRALRLLGLAGRERDQRLEWDEPAPERSGPALRGVEVELPPVPPGRYRLRLEIETRGRSPLVRELPIELRP